MKKNIFLIKANILKNIRDFFVKEGFLEVDTPCLVTSPDPSPFNEVFKKEKGMKVFDYDHEFVSALKSGIPRTAGIAVGIDRLVMLFADCADIHEVTLLTGQS